MEKGKLKKNFEIKLHKKNNNYKKYLKKPRKCEIV